MNHILVFVPKKLVYSTAQTKVLMNIEQYFKQSRLSPSDIIILYIKNNASAILYILGNY